MKNTALIFFMVALVSIQFIHAQETPPKPAEAEVKPEPTPENKPTPEAKPSPETIPADEVKPATPADVKPAAETKPAEPASPVVKPEEKPPVDTVKKEEPELDPETKRLIEEAKQKILKEKAEKAAAEKKAQEEAAKKAEDEKSLFGKLKANSNLYVGGVGGMALSLNKIHGTGFAFGGIVDYILYKHYGLHIGVETGQYPTQTINLTSGSNTIPLVSGYTLGFLAIDATAFYAFPKLFGIDSALGFGLAYYRVIGGNYEFNTMIAPKIAASFYYTIFPSLQVGLIWNMTIASASKFTNSTGDYTLDSSAGLTTMGLQAAIRYGLF